MRTKFIGVLIFLVSHAPHGVADKRTSPDSIKRLNTPNYIVSLYSSCKEYDISCKAVYRGVSKKTGKTITLNGGSLYRMCDDNETPCRFLGWQFRNGNTTYRIYEVNVEDGKDARLAVSREGKTLVDEQGRWESKDSFKN